MAGVYQSAIEKLILGWDAGGGVLGQEVKNLTLDPLLIDVVSGFSTGSEYRTPDRLVGMSGSFEFDTIMRGVGTPGSNAPVWEPLLKAAAFQVTVNSGAGTRTYAAAGTGFTTDDVAGLCLPMNMTLQIDRRKFLTLTNCVIDPTFILGSSNFPMIHCRVLCQIPAGHSVDAALPTNFTNTVPVAISGMTAAFTEVAAAVSATATSGGTTTVTVSGGGLLALGIQVGWIVTNVTTTSTGGGVVQAVTDTALTITALTGGSPSNISTSDVLSIAPPGTSFAVGSQNLRSATLVVGNNCQAQPGVNGARGYDPPRIVARTNGAIDLFDIQDPQRGTTYDWQRAAEVASADDAHYWNYLITHNSAGAAGYRFAFSRSGKPTGKGGTLSNGSDGALRRSLPFEQRGSGSGPLTIVLN